MSTNRVGDGQRAERRMEEDRRDKRQQGAKREDKRSFSKMMQKREMPSGERRGDERGRMLREGTEQTGSRQERAKHAERHHSQRMQSFEKGERKKESAKTEKKGGDGETSRGEGKEAADGKGLPVGDEDSLRATDDGVREIQNQTGSSEKAKAMEASKGKHAAIEEVARQIVDAVRVGEDSQQRRVVFLDVTVPGRGEVRIRLRRDGGGMEVRMRADNDGLARSLQEGVGQLREKGAEEDIEFTSIRVVR